MKISNILSRKNRILLRELVITDFKLRYQGSVLGYLWSLLKPLFLFAILYTVFVHFLKFGQGIEHFAVSLLLGIVLWNFFVESTLQGMQAIVSRSDLIRKINFPKYIIVISGTLSALINLLLNLLVVSVFIIGSGVELRPEAILFPLLLAELYVFSLAVAFFLAAAYVKYRDINHIWEVLLQAGFYATPILYPISEVAKYSPEAAKALMLSPMAQIIQDSRYVLITEQTQTLYSMVEKQIAAVVPFLIVFISIVLASWYFKKNAKYFAENV
jgi:ABC-2 type transport system permease protein